MHATHTLILASVRAHTHAHACTCAAYTHYMREIDFPMLAFELKSYMCSRSPVPPSCTPVFPLFDFGGAGAEIPSVKQAKDRSYQVLDTLPVLSSPSSLTPLLYFLEKS